MASEAALNLIIGLKDEASGKLGKLSDTLGGLAKFGGAAILGGAVAGIGALGAALATGIGDARAAAIVFAQTESAIKATGNAAGVTADHVADFAASLSAASGKSLFGDDQIQESSNLLLTFKDIKGVTLDAATAISVDMAQALGGKPADAAVQLGKALNNPIEGISALSRVGVTFSEDQKAVIKSLQEGGDMAGAQAIILKELNSEFGGSAEAAAKADGGVTMFKDRMGELAESVGAKVLPALNTFMGWLNSPEVQAGIGKVVDGLVDGLGAAFTWISGTAMPVLQAAFQTVWPIIQTAVATFSEFFTTTVWPALQTAFTWLSNTALPALQVAFQTVWPIIQQAVDTAYQFFSQVVWPWLQQNFDLLQNTVLPSLQKAFDEVWPKIQAAVQAVYAWLHDTFFPWLQGTAIPWLADVALPALRTAFETVWPLIEAAVRTVYQFFRDTVWPWLSEALRNTTEKEIPAIKKAFETAWPIIKTAVEAVYTWLSTVAWPWISENFANLRTWLQEVEDKFNEVWPKIQAAVTTVYTYFHDTVWPWLKTALENIKTWIDGVQTRWNTAWDAIAGAVRTAKDTIVTVIDTIKAAVRTAIDMINQLIDLINHIPGVDIPTLPGPDDQSGKSLTRPRTPLGGLPTPTASMTTQSRAVTFQPGSIVINNPRNAEDVSIGLQSAFQSAGLM